MSSKMLASCVSFLAMAAFATAAPTPSNDIFYLTSCNTDHSAIIYYTSPPADNHTLFNSKWNYADIVRYPGNTNTATIEQHDFSVTIDTGANVQPEGTKVGTANYADIATCSTGYDIFNCYTGSGDIVNVEDDSEGEKCWNQFYCTRANQSVC